MRWDEPRPTDGEAPGPSDEDLCLLAGGHFWMTVPVGAVNQCDNCGQRGALNVPSVDTERDVGHTGPTRPAQTPDVRG